MYNVWREAPKQAYKEDQIVLEEILTASDNPILANFIPPTNSGL